MTIDHLRAAKACPEGLRQFKRVFPTGATWPADRAKASAAGLDVPWAEKTLGLLPQIGDSSSSEVEREEERARQLPIYHADDGAAPDKD